MYKIRGIGLLIFCLSLGTSLFAQYTKADIYTYIENYKDLAVKKMHEYKIPASITLAQGVFESAAGTSRLAKEGNNHFGIKCHLDWQGDTLLVDDDSLGECFRRYEDVEASFTDHSLFLTGRPRYSQLFTLNVMDYKAWAHGLKAAGYATNPKYAERLTNLIETFHLAQYDTLYLMQVNEGIVSVPKVEKPATVDRGNEVVAQNVKPDKKPDTADVENRDSELVENTEKKEVEKSQIKTDKKDSPSASTETARIFFSATKGQYAKGDFPFSFREVYVNNRTYFVIAEAGDTYAQIAEDVQDSEKNIRKFNDMGQYGNPSQGEVIYIETKARMNTMIKTHTIEKGETLRFIAQKYGIQLYYLLRYNNFTEETVIYPGQIIKLRPN